MSAGRHRRPAARRVPPAHAGSANIFAALADDTRLSLLTALSQRPRLSIASLTTGSRLTRQAITKHLRVLRDAGLVRHVRKGREQIFELQPSAIDEARRALDSIALQWEGALLRLKAFVEQ